jgi:integrase
MAKGDGTVYKRGQVWYIKFYRDRQQIVMSCPRLTEAQAREKLKAELRKSDEDFVIPKEKRVTIQELIDDLRAHYEMSYRPDVALQVDRAWTNHLKEFFGKTRAAKITTEMQRKYRLARAGEGAASATVNREIQYLRRAYRVAYDQDPPKVKRLPKFVMLKENNTRKGFVTVPQMAALKQAAARFSMEWRVLVELAHWLGWRCGELLNLKVSNFRLHDGGSKFGVIRLESDETKNGRAREVPMTETLYRFVAPFIQGRPSSERLFSFTSIQSAWKKITIDAGLPNLLFHDLRRSSARTKRAAGVDTSIIMEMMGWTSDSMFRRYGIVDNGDKESALARQEEFEKRQLTERSTIQ